MTHQCNFVHYVHSFSFFANIEFLDQKILSKYSDQRYLCLHLMYKMKIDEVSILKQKHQYIRNEYTLETWSKIETYLQYICIINQYL